MNKFLIVLVASVCLSACARVQFRTIKGEPGDDCSVVQALNGAQVTCGDMTVFVPNGESGSVGEPGNNGTDGNDGSSCTVTSVPEGALISCTDGSSALVTNGKDGKDGHDGKDADPTDGNNGSGNDDKDNHCKDSDADKNCGKGNDK